MKLFIISLVLIISSQISFAQKDNSEKYKKLEKYYSESAYADVIFNAEKMIDNEKYSKDPEPYLYSSKAFLGIYKNPEEYPEKKFPDFKNPLKFALSDFAKFRKHDKSGEVYAENKDYAAELKSAVIETTEGMTDKKDAMKLAMMSRDIAKAFNNDAPMMMLSAGYLLSTNNIADGLKNADSALALLKKNPDIANASDDDKKALSKGFILYTDYLISKKEMVKAIDAITLASSTLPLDDAIKTQAEKINSEASKQPATPGAPPAKPGAPPVKPLAPKK